MGKHSARLARAEQDAHRREVELARRATSASRPALLDSVLAKADCALAGDVLPPADWTNAPGQVVAHRERLLEWLRTRRQD